MLCLVFRTYGRHKFKADSGGGLGLGHEGVWALCETGKGACKLPLNWKTISMNKELNNNFFY